MKEMARCEICGKEPQFGHNVSHALNRTKRRFKPNIQKRTVIISGAKRQIKVCTKCLRSLDKMIAEGKLPR
jgi:large subunit ribosomal protein L28